MVSVFNEKFSFDLRSRPFERDSQFVVMTGGPVSGKTSVLEYLDVSYEPEVARVYIERELKAGRTKHEIRADEAQFQKGLVDTKCELEFGRNPDALHFFDRALPDSITYYRAAGLDPEPLLECCKKLKYAAVFLFDLLPDEVVTRVLANDPVRTEDLHTRRLLDRFLEQDYTALGHPVIRVPAGTIRERADFVRSHLAKKEKFCA